MIAWPMPAPSIHITVRCFAAVREWLGRDELSLEVPPGTTVAEVLPRLAAGAPQPLRAPVAFAVNRDYARADRVLRDGDEVAFIPPISGGSGARDIYRFELVREPIDPRPFEQEVLTAGDGALVTFAGTTRDHNDGAAVVSLSYEAYPEMAQKVMGAIFEEAVKRFPITRARVVHRLGEVPVGEASVLVVVAAAHRSAAFDACRFLMDRLKNEVPIFKRERLAQGRGERWVGELPKPGQG
jgi:molybdopterin synthase catalytic subunit